MVMQNFLFHLMIIFAKILLKSFIYINEGNVKKNKIPLGHS